VLNEAAADRSLQRDEHIRNLQDDPNISKGQHDKLMQQSGLHERGLRFEGLACDPYTQTPHDPFHCEYLGMAKKATTHLSNCLDRKAITALNARIDHFNHYDRPSHWSVGLPLWNMNSSKSGTPGSLKWTGGQLGKFTQVAAVILDGFLCVNHFRPSIKTQLKDQLGEHFPAQIIKCFTSLGKLNKELFRSAHGNVEAAVKRIKQLVIESRRDFLNVWGPFGKNGYSATPSIHVCVHYPQTHIDFGGNRLANVERQETKHGPIRRVINNTNHRALERDMMAWSNAKNGIDFIAAGGARHLEHHRKPGSEFLKFLKDPCIVSLLKGASLRGRTQYEDDDRDDDCLRPDSDSDSESNEELEDARWSENVVTTTKVQVAVDTELQDLMQGYFDKSVCDNRDLQVMSIQHIILVDREAWRSKVHKGQFFSLKKPFRMDGCPPDAVAFCQDIFEFRWTPIGKEVQSVVVLVSVRWASLDSETSCFDLELMPSALVHTADLDSPLHLVHMCDGNKCKMFYRQRQLEIDPSEDQHGKKHNQLKGQEKRAVRVRLTNLKAHKHDLSNPKFSFNPTCF
jgi:hypothetical protein